MPLLELAARKGFWTLPLSYLRKLGEHLNWNDALKDPLIPTIVKFSEHAIPKCNDGHKHDALQSRGICYDDGSEDLARVLGLEFICEMFDGNDKQTLQNEITTAKERIDERNSYQSAFKAYKVARCLHASNNCQHNPP